MTRRLVAIAVLVVLAVSTVGRLDALAATENYDPVEVTIAETDIADIATPSASQLKATPRQFDCLGCAHCLGSVCSLDAVAAISAVEPTLRYRRAGWRLDSERLHKTILDPGLRPPIPVS